MRRMSRRDHFSGENMKSSSLTSRFLAGFEPLVLPPRGPDGMIPAGPPAKLPVVQPPSLCEAGPCRHYHRVASVMDAEDGGSAGPTHRQVTRACYPAVGIELELGETPVLQCSRWEPDNEQARLDSIRADFLKKPDGKAFVEKVAAFEEACADDDDEYEYEDVIEKTPALDDDAIGGAL
jgi:hypothetical protein